MAYIFTLPDGTSSVNMDPSSGAQAIWWLKEVLKNAGWTVKQTFVGGAASVLTPNTTGSAADMSLADLNTNGSWFVIQQPAGTAADAPFNGSRQYLFYRGNNAQSWYIGYSRTGGFGNGNSSTIAYASDEKNVTGSSARNGSNMPSTSIVFGANYASNSWLNIGASDTAPFTFYMFGYSAGDANKYTTAAIFTEAFASGTFTFDSNNPADSTKSDLDPLVHCSSWVWAGQSGNATNVLFSGSEFYANSWYKLNTANASWDALTVSTYSNYGTDPINSKVVLAPVAWGNSSAGKGPRGVGVMIKNAFSTVSNGTLATVSSAGDRIIFQDYSFPWPGSAYTPEA